MINTALLKSRMILAGISTQAFADALGWSKSTAYRKIAGHVAFTATEIQKCVTLLSLDLSTASDIFFTSKMS